MEKKEEEGEEEECVLREMYLLFTIPDAIYTLT
jgi:hypothetical protein